MQDTNIFVEKVDSSKRQIGWTELNQLKKDTFCNYLKMLDLTDVKNFYSDKDLTRFDYLKRSFLIIGCIAIALSDR